MLENQKHCLILSVLKKTPDVGQYINFREKKMRELSSTEVEPALSF